MKNEDRRSIDMTGRNSGWRHWTILDFRESIKRLFAKVFSREKDISEDVLHRTAPRIPNAERSAMLWRANSCSGRGGKFSEIQFCMRLFPRNQYIFQGNPFFLSPLVPLTWLPWSFCGGVEPSQKSVHSGLLESGGIAHPPRLPLTPRETFFRLIKKVPIPGIRGRGYWNSFSIGQKTSDSQKGCLKFLNYQKGCLRSDPLAPFTHPLKSLH